MVVDLVFLCSWYQTNRCFPTQSYKNYRTSRIQPPCFPRRGQYLQSNPTYLSFSADRFWPRVPVLAGVLPAVAVQLFSYNCSATQQTFVCCKATSLASDPVPPQLLRPSLTSDKRHHLQLAGKNASAHGQLLHVVGQSVYDERSCSCYCKVGQERLCTSRRNRWKTQQTEYHTGDPLSCLDCSDLVTVTATVVLPLGSSRITQTIESSCRVLRCVTL